MYADIFALERSALDRRNQAEAEAANERRLGLLPDRPSRLVMLLRRIGAVHPAPVQEELRVRPSYLPAARPIPVR